MNLERGMAWCRRILIIPLFITTNAFSWFSELYPPSWQPPAVEQSFYTEKIIQDFSFAGYHRGEKAIPMVSAHIIDVTNAPYNADKTGTNDATAAIQSAIDKAAHSGGAVVYLPEGTYKVNPGSNNYALRITGSNVVLRGDGVGKTRLLNTSNQMRNKSVIDVAPDGGQTWTNPSSIQAKITRDLMGPTRSIPVDSISLFKKGDWVLLRSSITEAWCLDHNENDWIGFSFRGFMYYRKVEKVDTESSVLTIDVPIRYAMKMRDDARVHLSPAMLEEVGLEHFSIGNIQHNLNSGWDENSYSVPGTAAYDCHGSFLMSMSRTRDSWVRSVESYKHPDNTSGAHMLSNGVRLSYSRGITIDSCHFQYGQYGGGGGNGYMYRIEGNETLLKNCSATFCRHGFVLSHMYASGNVFFRCEDNNTGRQTGTTGSMNTIGAGSDHHMHFSPSNLFDQCIANNSNFQAAYRPYGTSPKHNLTSAHSVYWNTRGEGNESTSWIIHSQQARYGYVIGTWGTRTAVRTSAVGVSAHKTDPVDHVEGIGTAQTLEPQSLYLDQFKRRMSGQPLQEKNTNSYKSAGRWTAGVTGNSILVGAPATVHADVNLYDVSGRLLTCLYRGMVNKKIPTRLPLPAVPAGTYMVIVRSGGERVAARASVVVLPF